MSHFPPGGDVGVWTGRLGHLAGAAGLQVQHLTGGGPGGGASVVTGTRSPSEVAGARPDGVGGRDAELAAVEDDPVERLEPLVRRLLLAAAAVLEGVDEVTATLTHPWANALRLDARAQ